MKENLNKKNNMINEIYNMRAEDLAQEKAHSGVQNKERFLDVVENVKDIRLKQDLINEYLKADDEFGVISGKLIKKYYTSRICRWG